MDFNSGPKVRFPWGSGYWPVPFSPDEALQIAGLFHQGQFPYCSGYEARRVQHFPDFNLESIFISKIRPISVKRWKLVWILAGPIVLLVNLQQLAIVWLKCWHV